MPMPIPNSCSAVAVAASVARYLRCRCERDGGRPLCQAGSILVPIQVLLSVREILMEVLLDFQGGYRGAFGLLIPSALRVPQSMFDITFEPTLSA